MCNTPQKCFLISLILNGNNICCKSRDLSSSAGTDLSNPETSSGEHLPREREFCRSSEKLEVKEQIYSFLALLFYFCLAKHFLVLSHCFAILSSALRFAFFVALGYWKTSVTGYSYQLRICTCV